MVHSWLLVTVLILAVVTQLHSVSLKKAPFRSKKSPTETIHYYEVVDPDVSFSAERSNEGHSKIIEVVLKSERETFYLNLKLNENLLSPKFVSGYHIDGEKQEDTHENCFYHGTVKGHEAWNAVFSACYGLRGWFGDLNDRNNLYHIEPMENTISLTAPHALYIDSEHHNDKEQTCGTNHKHKIGALPLAESIKSHDNHMLKKRQDSSGNLIVEWLLINDFVQYENYNRNISAVALRAIELANHVDMLYQALGIRITLVASLTWTTSQQITTTSDPDTLLNLFEAYHRTNNDLKEIVHDSAMLITGIEITGSTVGVAFLGTMCNYDTSVGFTQDTGSSVISVGGIASHELGHIFNMEHDAQGCQCPDGDTGCIMSATLGFPPPTKFSQCSRNKLQEGIDFKGASICLNNNPTMIFGDPACGNGIKEPGEICDCGSLEECQDRCCNATTCTLTEGSQCAEGECCDDTCQFIEYGTTCRESSGMCGITEYCSGQSAECPRDVYIQNGISCENGAAYCYDGECVSLTAQCTLYYGQESEPSVQECYDGFNTQGQETGHCGTANNAYIPCSSENARCGSIQCKGGQINFGNIEFTGTITSYTRSVSANGSFEQCKTFSTAADADIISPGLVLEGTKCGNGQLCLSQQCVDITTLGISPCVVGANGSTCSGNGVCNNLDQCSCIVGFNGSDCSQTASATNSDRNTGNTAAIAGGVSVVIILLIIISVVIVVVVIVLLLNKNKTGSKNLRSPAKSRYGNRRTSESKRPGIHGSTDDLLMTGIPRNSNTPSPIPPAHESRSYKPYVPPSYPSPSTTISQNVRRPPPAPSTTPQFVVQKPSPRPPPPSRKPPSASVKPSAPSRPVPPSNKPEQSPQKPIPAVRTNIGVQQPYISPRPPPPQTAQKPSKIAVQWPPPSEDTTATRPIPPKKPMVPRK